MKKITIKTLLHDAITHINEKDMKNTDPYKAGDAYKTSLLSTDACSDDRSVMCFHALRLALEMYKVCVKDEEDGKRICDEIDFAYEFHANEYAMLKDFAYVFQRMHEHIEIAKSALKDQVAMIRLHPDTDPGGLGRDAEKETLAVEALNFFTMLENVHEGRDPHTGARHTDVEAKAPLDLSIPGYTPETLDDDEDDGLEDHQVRYVDADGNEHIKGTGALDGGTDA